jgi:DNA replication protein DnaC
MQQFFERQLRTKNVVRHPHTAGSRSASLAARIAALPEQERTPLQERLLLQHQQGECIGCTRQGVPIDMYGNDVLFRYESNGFASPPEFCDCPKGQQYQQWLEQRRAHYDRERVTEHLRYLRYLFGSACVLPTVMAGWTIDTWPVDLTFPDEWEQSEQELALSMRRNVQACVQYYAEHLTIWDETVYKQGIALVGVPGVGKSGLLRCLEPVIIARGLSMVSLYVPDLVVALESEQVEQMIAAILATDVVLFDNLGFIVSIGYKEAQGRLALIRLINARWERQRKTLFTSNATEEQLIEQLGADSVSRLHALCRFFEVPGMDLRQGGMQWPLQK